MAASEQRDLAEIGVAFARAVSEDLAPLVGEGFRVKGPGVGQAERDAALPGDGPLVHLSGSAGEAGSVHIVIPRPDAATLASLASAQDAERIASVREQELDDDTRTALEPLAEKIVAALDRVLSEQFSLPSLSSEGMEEVSPPLADDARIPAGLHRLARFRLAMPEQPEGRLVLLVPESLAQEWFGDWSEEQASSEPEGDESTGGSLSIVVLDANDEDRKQIEDLEGDLGCSVWAIDPDEFDPDDLAEFNETGAFLIAWDLGVRPGVDLLEELRRAPLTASVPIVMVAAEPTAPMVRAGLLAGADAFACKPYDADEIRARLRQVTGKRAA